VIKLALLTYASILTHKMVTLGDDKNETFALTANEDLEVKLGDTELKYTISLYDTST